MAKKTRIILIVSLAIIFLVLTPLLISYSQGYRFDLEKRKITQTGGFYFKVWPKSAQVFLDGKLAEKTDLFFGAVYISNLIPKNYEVQIRKEGYHSWKKTLQVQEKQVTDAKNIILLPLNPNFEELAQNVEQIPQDKKESPENLKNESKKYYIDEKTQTLYFFDAKKDSFGKLFENSRGAKISPDAKKLLYFSNSEIWVMFLETDLGQPENEMEKKLLVARFGQGVGEVFWLGSYYLIFNVGEKIKVAEIDDRQGINIIDFAEFAEPEIFFNAQDKRLYLISGETLYASQALLP